VSGPGRVSLAAVARLTSGMDEPPTLSDDGNYWWDGTAWQLVDPLAAGGTASCERGQVNGACVAYEVSDDEIRQALGAAGASLEA
jgi:hypothetical protein